ncbi:MAG: terminase family protein [Sphingomicrobium sp.]
MRRVDQTKLAVALIAEGAFEEAVAMVMRLPVSALITLDTRFEAWAAEGQLAPDGDGWRLWLIQAGRGFGKTRAGAEWVHGMAMARHCRVALVGATLDETRRVMVEGPSGILAVAQAHGTCLKWVPAQRKLTWPNGSTATLFSGEDGDGLRGPEHDFAWCDELAKWGDAEGTWDNLMFGLRRGRRPRALVTTTPRTIPLLDRLRAMDTTIVTGGTTADNVNLSQEFVNQMITSYKGTRLEHEELRGRPLTEVAGSLWPRATIARCRVDIRTLPPMERIVVGVDPPAGEKATSDACGIVVAGRAGANIYVLADASVKGASPERWAAAVRAATAHWGADRIVAEANNGGMMVKSVLVAAGVPGAQVRLVHASRGKCARAEPVSLAYEAGAGWFAGVFGALEDELAGMQIGGGYEGPTRSPDRADAMVWAMTELMGRMGAGPRVIGL